MADDMTALRKEMAEHKRIIEHDLRNEGEPSLKQIEWLLYGMYDHMEQLVQYHTSCPALAAWRVVSSKVAQVLITLVLVALVYAIIVAVQAGFRLP